MAIKAPKFKRVPCFKKAPWLEKRRRVANKATWVRMVPDGQEGVVVKKAPGFKKALGVQ